MKSTSSFVCQQCGYNSPRYLGKCPECGAWNSLVEVVERKSTPIKSGSKRNGNATKALKLSEIKNNIQNRISTGFSEMDRVLGGGIVKGQVTLLAGDPGIGKSTLLLETALALAKEFKVLYITGEESPQQVKMRALRLRSGLQLEASAHKNLYLLAQTLVEEAVEIIEDINPDIIIVDSIQSMQSETLTGSAGSIGQIRQSASILIAIAKEKDVPVFLVGHVTKEGTIAGPMVLSHMVDTVLFLEGERFKTLRILRSLKNRFGPVDEVGVFKMNERGIEEEKNPSELFLGWDDSTSVTRKVPGSAIVASIEGTRPILVEVQSLVLPSKLAVARRVVSGLDPRRVELLCAVLQKTCRLPLDRFDIFVNLAGGLTLREPGIDLGIALAIYSSLKGKVLAKTVAIGEVGLLGELRRVPDSDKREREAKKLGFTKILTADKYRDLWSVLRNI